MPARTRPLAGFLLGKSLRQPFLDWDELDPDDQQEIRAYLVDVIEAEKRIRNKELARKFMEFRFAGLAHRMALA